MDNGETPQVEEVKDQSNQETTEETQDLSGGEEVTLSIDNLSNLVSKNVKDSLTSFKDELKTDISKMVEDMVSERIKKKIVISKPTPSSKVQENNIENQMKKIEDYLTKFA